MVVISAAVCTRNGKCLVSRQFVEITRIRIEGLLGAFPKLLGGENKQQQHTFIETDSVRYLYQPLESLYLILVTNKASNIVQDLETLRLLSKVVPDISGGLTENLILEKCFELVFAFDEAITTGGYQDATSLQQIRTNLEMQSQNEELHLMIKKQQMEQAEAERKKKEQEITEKNRQAQGNVGGGISSSSYRGFGSSSIPLSDPMVVGESTNQYSSMDKFSSTPSTTSTTKISGMQLQPKSNKAQKMMMSLVNEDNLNPIPISQGNAIGITPAIQQSSIMHQPVTLSAEEKIQVHLSKEGTVEGIEIKGVLSLGAHSDDASFCRVHLDVKDPYGFTFQTHPKINKAVYENQKVLMLKEPEKGFPLDKDIGILRWHLNTGDSRLVPLTINCWPEEEGRGEMNVNVEYTLNRPIELHHVEIQIPLGTTTAAPRIVSVDGNCRHQAANGILLWQIDMIDGSNRSGSLEFNILSNDSQAFFPIQISFASPNTFCHVTASNVLSTKDDHPIAYGYSSSLGTENYLIN